MRYRMIVAVSVLVTMTMMCLAQSDQPQLINATFYYNQNWELTSPENAFYKREASFDLKDMTFDGVYKDYNKEDKLIAEGYYVHGIRNGLQSEYFEDQSISTTLELTDDDFIIWQKVTPDKKYEVIRGTGKFSMRYYYLYDLHVKQGVLEGEFLNGKKIGKWIYRDLAGRKTDSELFENGHLKRHFVYKQTDSVAVNYRKEIILSLSAVNTQAFAFDKTIFSSLGQYFAKYLAFPQSFSREVSFAGGLKKLLKVLSNSSSLENGYLILARLKVDEQGQLVKLGLVRYADPFNNDNVQKILQEFASYFLPAIENGKPVASVVYLPVASGDEWQELLRAAPTDFFTNPSNFE